MFLAKKKGLQKQDSAFLVTTRMIAKPVTPESGLVQADIPMTPTRVEMNMDGSGPPQASKPRDTFQCNKRKLKKPKFEFSVASRLIISTIANIYLVEKYLIFQRRTNHDVSIIVYSLAVRGKRSVFFFFFFFFFFAQKSGYGEEEFCVKRSRLTVLQQLIEVHGRHGFQCYLHIASQTKTQDRR